MKHQLTDFDRDMIRKSVELAIANVDKGGRTFWCCFDQRG